MVSLYKEYSNMVTFKMSFLLLKISCTPSLLIICRVYNLLKVVQFLAHPVHKDALSFHYAFTSSYITHSSPVTLVCDITNSSRMIHLAIAFDRLKSPLHSGSRSIEPYKRYVRAV